MPLVLWCAQRISHAPSQSRWYHNTLAKQGKCEMFICIIWNIFGTKKKRNATQQNKRREEKSESLIVAQPKFIALKWIIPNSERHTHTHIEIGHIWTAKFITYIFVLLFSSVRFGSVQVHHNWTIWNVFAEFSEAIVSKRASEQAIHSRWLFLELVFPSSMNALYLVCRRWFNSHHEHCQRHFISHIITANFVAYFICLPFLSFTLFFLRWALTLLSPTRFMRHIVV